MKSWIVGSSVDCDIRIDEQAVSSAHCKLTANGHGFILEDLQSTNGTYVNGHQVTSTTTVTREDRVTLGKKIALRWPEEPTKGDSVIVTVGANPDNDFVLDKPSISGNHAVLTIRADGIRLEDLSSTNGTFVGSKNNKIKDCLVGENDPVWLGSYKTSVREIKSHARQTTPVSLPVTANDPVPMYIAGATGIALLLGLVFLSVALFSDRHADSDNNPDPDASQSEPLANEVLSQPEPGRTAAISEPEPSRTQPLENSSPTEPTIDQPWYLTSTLVITQRSPEDFNEYRIGNAWAISERLLITTASVIDNMDQLAEEKYSSPAAVSLGGNEHYSIIDRGVMPTYGKYRATFEEIRTKIIDISTAKLKADENAKPSKEDIELGNRLLDTRDMMAGLNLGWIRLKDPVPTASVFKIDNSVKLRPSQRVTLAGHLIDAEDPFYDFAEPHKVSSEPLRVTGLLKAGKIHTGWVVAGTDILMNHEIEGAAAIDSQGRFAGIFSRMNVPQSEDGLVLALIPVDTILEMTNSLDET